ncbi:MAG: tryptophan-rich sensory protein [Candidatus Dojkabacteria bacterium]|nr:MAG: tryptophan-rich sensory protein [Candidatus Dojkabacteria bacterium]
MKTIFTKTMLLLATLGMIAVNAMANILPFNNLTTAAVSDSLVIYFVPAGYVFGIWGIIYLLLIGFVLKYLLSQETTRFSTLLPYYFLSTILNAGWIVLWHYGYFLTTGVVMVALLLTLIALYQQAKQLTLRSRWEFLTLSVPFSVYLSWICVATIANLSGILWLFRWDGFGIAEPLWAAIMMGIAGILAVLFALREKDFVFPLVTIWALVGIMIKFPTQQEMLYVGIASVSAIVLVLLKQGYSAFTLRNK